MSRARKHHLAIVLGLLTPVLAFAQVNTATIFGTVTDPTGAAVAQANVTATNEQTAGSWKTATDVGQFTFTFLPLGRYTVVIRAAGFKEERRTGLERAAGQEVRFSYALTLGAQAESVTVTGEAPVIDTANAKQDPNATLRYLNTAAFQKVPLGKGGMPLRPGNAGRNSLRGPGFWNLDLALSKNFKFTERHRLQVRSDMLNSLNHTNFGIPTGIDAANFGRFTSTRGARMIQFNARLQF